MLKKIIEIHTCDKCDVEVTNYVEMDGHELCEECANKLSKILDDYWNEEK